MSYILDALRKSERERALGNVRTLEAPVATPAVSGNGRALRWIIILALIAVVAALGWAFADRLAGTLSRLATNPEPQTLPDSRAGAGAAEPDSSAGGIEQAPPVAATPVTPALPVADPGASPTAPESAGVQASAPSVAPGPAPSEAAAPVILSLSNAPQAVRDATARLFLSVVSYSREPQRRFVMINQVFYREGNRLPGGAVLRRIEPDGAVVAYAGSEVLLKP